MYYVIILLVLSNRCSAKNMGTDYEVSLFGMKDDDCISLDTALKSCHLSVLQLSNNLLNDDSLSLLLDGLKDCKTLIKLGTKIFINKIFTV